MSAAEIIAIHRPRRAKLPESIEITCENPGVKALPKLCKLQLLAFGKQFASPGSSFVLGRLPKHAPRPLLLRYCGKFALAVINWHGV
jgi:hypothetical protein